MYLVIFLLLLVPGMLTWFLVTSWKKATPEKWSIAIVKWLIYDLLIMAVCYLFLNWRGDGTNVASFSGSVYVDYARSVYHTGFVSKYALADIVAAVLLAVAVILLDKLTARYRKK